LSHDFIEEWREVIGSHGRVGKSNNTIEASSCENITVLLNNLGEVLLVDFQATNIDIISIDLENIFIFNEKYFSN
jgi:hypothetical protein